MRIRIIIAAAALLVLGAGMVHGRWTNRWRDSAAIQAASERIQSLPERIGDWTATEQPLSEAERKAAGAVGCSSRRYRRDGDGAVVSTLLICGLPGAVGAHTPDVCYTGGGFDVAPPAPLAVPRSDAGPSAQFLSAAAVRGGASPLTLQILWSWNDGGGWRAPEDPRWAFAAAPVLSKLYVVRETAGAAPTEGAADPSLEFLDALLPALDRHVFSTPADRPSP